MYIIASHISIVENDHLFFIIDSSNNKMFEINMVIYEMLAFFKSPNSIENYICNLSEKLQHDESKIAEIVMPFFEKLLKNQFIIDENTKTVKENKSAVLLGDFIDNKYKVLQILQKKNNNNFVLLVEDCLSDKLILKHVLFTTDKEFNAIKDTIKYEFEITKKLSNLNNIVRSLDYVEKKDFTYLAMEYADGYKNLSDYIKEDKIDEVKKIELINEILNTYKHIHNCKILHGDIHHKNILVLNQRKIKIIDFELATSINSRNEKGYRKGAIHYFIPPERLGNNCFIKVAEPSSVKGEIYQLGILIHFIIFECFPFEYDKWSELNEKISSGINSLPQKHYITNFLLKSLNVDPLYRFNTVEEMEQAWLQLNKEYKNA